MTREDQPHAPTDETEISLVALANVLLRRRRLIVAMGFAGGVIGLASGLVSTRVYKAPALFVPQGSESMNTGLLAAAGQLGIRLPAGGGSAWGPSMYVEVLRSHALLEPIALDTIVIAEEEGRRVAVMDLLNIKPGSPEVRLDGAVRKLQAMVDASEVKTLGAVRVSVTTRWPSVSLALTQRLVRGVDAFNFETRKSQATAERAFVVAQAAAAESALFNAEERLKTFLERNRDFQGARLTAGSPQLAFQKDRLDREVVLRQQLYTSLLQSAEEARIREVRDTPVITVLEEPRLPVLGEPRRSPLKAVVGAILAGAVAALFAFGAHAARKARGTTDDETREFLQLVNAATPRFLRKLGQ